MTGGALLALLIWGEAGWRGPAVVIALVLLALVVWGYRRSALAGRWRTLAITLKVAGVAILLLCLLEPLWSGVRARPGANLFVVLADNSQSMTLHDGSGPQTRGEQVRPATTQPLSWMRRIGEDFDVRVHAFDTTLRSVDNLASLKFDGDASNLAASLGRIARQYVGRPLAGVLLFTDGRATDVDAIDRVLDARDARLPPVYPVVLGGDTPARDINLQRVDVSQTDFEDAPVTLTATIVADGYRGREVVVRLIDDAGAVVEEQSLPVAADGAPIVARFKLRPKAAGVSFYKVAVSAKGVAAGSDDEATLANNTRLVTVDRGRGPYRVLYVGGRPNWEFKFLQRSIAEDDQIELVGLIRIAKREPKFAYIGRAGDASNPLFRGFENKDAEQAEQYDQPVLVRLGTRNADELRGGFPRTADELNAFSAVVLDDVEAEFFTQDQLLLLKEFVRQRGGGLLMLGGQESFREGKYDRTPVGDVLPVYASDAEAPAEASQYRLSLTREGWLAPWVRLRADEAAERARVTAMPTFRTLNAVRGVKPGATVLASADATTDGGQTTRTGPALVEQRFGKGRGAALLIGDLWRWTLRRPADAPDDLPKAWRQTIRWLVSDVPKRVDLTVPRQTDDIEQGDARTIQVRVRDAAFGPQDNAAVAVRVTTPDGKAIDLPADASAAEAGLYEATFVPRQAGAYRVKATAADADGREIATAEAGWTSDPSADEFNDLRPDRALLQRVADRTGGRMVAAADLDGFARTLPSLHADVTDPDIRPLWHSPFVLAAAVACLAAEWGLRRWKGLP